MISRVCFIQLKAVILSRLSRKSIRRSRSLRLSRKRKGIKEKKQKKIKKEKGGGGTK